MKEKHRWKKVARFLADFRALCLGDGKQNNIGAIQTKVREQWSIVGNWHQETSYWTTSLNRERIK